MDERQTTPRRDEPAVTNNAAARRFELHVSGHTAFLDYVVSEGLIHLVHTEVPPALEGRGFGGQLARAGLEFARRENLKVVPDCAFVRGYIARHPEYAPLVDGGEQ